MISKEEWFDIVEPVFKNFFEAAIFDLVGSPDWSAEYIVQENFSATGTTPGRGLKYILRSNTSNRPCIRIDEYPVVWPCGPQLSCNITLGYEDEFSTPGGRTTSIEDYFHIHLNRLDLEKMLDWHPGEDVTAYFTRVFELGKFALRGELEDVVEGRKWIAIHTKNPRDYGY